MRGVEAIPTAPSELKSVLFITPASDATPEPDPEINQNRRRRPELRNGRKPDRPKQPPFIADDAPKWYSRDVRRVFCESEFIRKREAESITDNPLFFEFKLPPEEYLGAVFRISDSICNFPPRAVRPMRLGATELPIPAGAIATAPTIFNRYCGNRRP